jgi:hypothetical protein
VMPRAAAPSSVCAASTVEEVRPVITTFAPSEPRSFAV